MPPVGAALATIGGFIGANAAAIGTVASVAGTGAAIVQGNKASKQAKNAAADQASRQSGLEADLVNRRNTAESEANAANTRDAARRRQAQMAIGAGGRQDTILTGPQGEVGDVTGKKTLLGT